MRIGNNPLRNQPAPYQFKDIIFVVVTHLPCEMSEYHSERMEIVKVCLSTMRNNCHRDHSFVVWDNGSKSEFRDWLQHIFEPDMLVLSPNIGKNQARASAIRMLPPQAVVCYSDDDILYYDNWLEPQLKLLNHFGAQIVTGYPVRTMMRWGNERTIAWSNKNASLEIGRFIPNEWEKDYAVSIGRDPDYHVSEYTKRDLDYRVTYKGESAYCTSHHCQFIGYVARILGGLEYDYDGAMSDEKPFDIKMDLLGLRLATTERLTRHMGNVIDDKLRQEIYDLKVPQ
jgi:glycosyltransferase involved in cell wall biosynthesis